MTNEEIIKVLHELDGSLYETQQVALDLAIKALEQQPCEDCISRQAALDNAYAYGNGLEPEGYCVNVEDIQALPPVTPTQSTCKDCKHNRPNSYARTMFSCERGNRFKLRDCEDFYCADFEKRGNENGSN